MTLFIEFAWRFKEYLVIAIMAALLFFAVSSCSSKERDIKQIKTEHELQLTTLKANYVETARNIERQAYEQTIQAVNDAKKREQVIIADAADARDSVDSLSATIDTLAANAATDADFRIKYTDTVGQSLKECSISITDLARQADGYTNDIRLLQESRRK